MGKYYALWRGPEGREWDGPFDDNASAREAVPEGSAGSVVTVPAVMTPGEALEARKLVQPSCQNGCPEGYRGRHKFSCALAGRDRK